MTHLIRRSLVGLGLALAVVVARPEKVTDATRPDPFLVKPYLQLGDAPGLQRREQMVVMWHGRDADEPWVVRHRQVTGRRMWRPAPVEARRVAVRSIEPHRVYRALLTGLEPGGEFDYEVRRGKTLLFAARGRARRPAHQFSRIVVFGDIAAGTPGQKVMAHRAFEQRPDMVFVTGDIVYSRGRISEYRQRYFPVYNADRPSLTEGAPLLRSTLLMASPGNHDIATSDLATYPDGLAYFLYWAQPLNGPLGTPGLPNTPILKGNAADQNAFYAAAVPQYPVMANFSFDYGNMHWTVLDANAYADWTQPHLRDWLREDLQKARGATWRFVGFHQPGFNSSKAHFNEQQMRVIADVLEEGKVDLVFSGHVHNYQRSYPMRFQVKPTPEGKAMDALRRVDGAWTLDRAFNGQTNTKPDGVIYVVTGAGGAGLYNREQQEAPATWQEFTARFVSTQHSLTVLDVRDDRVTVRQVGEAGQELDRFVLTR